MRNRPWPLILIALLHVIAPVMNLLVSAWISRMPLGTYTRQLMSTESTPELIAFFALLPIAGAAIYAIKSWSYPVFLLSVGFTFYTNFKSYQASPHLFNLPMLISTYLVNIGLVSYFLIPAVRTTYFDRSLRWWESKPRFRVRFPATIGQGQGETLEIQKCRIMNLSEGGAFVVVGRDLNPHQEVTLTFTFLEQEFSFHARIAHQDSQGRKGYGLQFVRQPSNLRLAKKLLKVLHIMGPSARERSQATLAGFRNWAYELVTTGKGLVPAVPPKRPAPGDTEPASEQKAA